MASTVLTNTFTVSEDLDKKFFGYLDRFQRNISIVSARNVANMGNTPSLNEQSDSNNNYSSQTFNIVTGSVSHVRLHNMSQIYVVVNFLSQVIFIFLLFLGMVIYANEVETKEK